MYKIKLNNIVLFGYHGCYPEERKMGQRFEIDAEVLSTNDDVLQTDEVSEVSDYTMLFQLIEREFKRKKFNLIETLASEIAQSLLRVANIYEATVRVRKPHASIDSHFSDIEVEVTKKK